MGRVLNRKEFTKRRQALRKQMPEAEVMLWSRLRGRQLYGRKFRRQYGVGPYSIDFYCPKLKVGIEIDGSSHMTKSSKAADKERQRYIESFGIGLLRYTNADVYDDIDGVVEQIAREIKKMEEVVTR